MSRAEHIMQNQSKKLIKGRHTELHTGKRRSRISRHCCGAQAQHRGDSKPCVHREATHVDWVGREGGGAEIRPNY